MTNQSRKKGRLKMVTGSPEMTTNIICHLKQLFKSNNLVGNLLF